MELQGERRDVSRVRHIRLGAGEQVGDRRGADIGEQRVAPAAQVLREEHALAQARARDLEAPVPAEPSTASSTSADARIRSARAA